MKVRRSNVDARFWRVISPKRHTIARNHTQLTRTSDKPSEELPSQESPKYPHTSPSEYSFRKRSAHAHHEIFFLSSPATVKGIVSIAELNGEVIYGDIFSLSGVTGLIKIAPHSTQASDLVPPPPLPSLPELECTDRFSGRRPFSRRYERCHTVLLTDGGRRGQRLGSLRLKPAR